MAPDFTLKSLDGREVSLSDFRGKNLILIDFWASWCPPCRAAMSSLAGLEQKYGAHGLKVISINQKEPRATVAKFVRERRYKPLVLLDEDGAAGDRYSVSSIPTLVLVDKKGKVRAFEEGFDFATQFRLEEEACKLMGIKRKSPFTIEEPPADERNRD